MVVCLELAGEKIRCRLSLHWFAIGSRWDDARCFTEHGIGKQIERFIHVRLVIRYGRSSRFPIAQYRPVNKNVSRLVKVISLGEGDAAYSGKREKQTGDKNGFGIHDVDPHSSLRKCSNNYRERKERLALSPVIM